VGEQIGHHAKIGLPGVSSETFTITDPDGIEITVDRWLPSDGAPVAVLHVLHGWAEHAGRYARFAGAANEAGIAVYADDHRGHGRTGLAAAGGLGDLGPRGMDGVLDAARAVSVRAFGEWADLPRFLLGHSWGSFIAQRYLRRWGADLTGALLTGTTLRREGAAPRAGGLNDRFDPAATPYDWLTRDAAEVQKYIDDPWCGFERMAASGATTPARTSTEARSPAEADVPPGLPILIFNGADDPIGGEEGGSALAAHYRASGVRDVTFRSYPGGRHELFNELNRDEVTADVLSWISTRVGG
jgi:alpha-beta hydrolase superfamily lysophospholipase